jgi:hypothetical protein
VKVEVAPPFSDSLPQRPALTSLFRYSPGLILIAIALIDSRRVTDPDLWGHLRFGRLILEHGLPRFDPFAYSQPQLPWINHEWGSEVAFAWAFARFGVLGIKTLKLLLSAIVGLSIASAIAETAAPIRLQLAVLVVTATRLEPQMLMRPQIFTYAMLAILLAILAGDNYRRTAPIWIVVPMFALWANLHGGFVVGLAALGTYALTLTAADVIGGRGFTHGALLLTLTAGAALATLATPYGFENWYSVAHTLSHPAMLGVIAEWQPLPHAIFTVWHQHGAGILYESLTILIIAGLIGSVAIGPRGGDLPLLAVALLLIGAAMLAYRNVPLALLGAAAPLTRHADLAVRKLSHPTHAPSAHESTAPPAFNEYFLYAVAFLMIAATGMLSNRLTFDDRYPGGATAFIEQRHLHGNILSTYAWNDYLLFHLSPPSRVFIDSRYEMIYPNRISRDFIEFFFARPHASVVLDSYPHDFVLIPVGSAAATVMDARRDWCVIYRDDLSLLYARTDSFAAHIPGIPVTGVSTFAVFP